MQLNACFCIHFFYTNSFLICPLHHLGGSTQALERQKEYTDAIRIERDDLREEVVKLQDILKVLSQCGNSVSKNVKELGSCIKST